jgi:hypothetical protein
MRDGCSAINCGDKGLSVIGMREKRNQAKVKRRGNPKADTEKCGEGLLTLFGMTMWGYGKEKRPERLRGVALHRRPT